MKEDKILQIIPAPKGIKAYYEDEGNKWSVPVVCLALVESATGLRYIEPVEMYSDSLIDIVGASEKSGAFLEITFPED